MRENSFIRRLKKLRKDRLKTEIFNQLSKEELVKKEEEIRISLLGNPNNFELLRELAVILYHKADYEGAIKIYKKVLEYKENKAQGLAFLGQLYYENEEYLKAIKAFEKSLDLNPDEAFVHFLLGNAYSHAGKLLEAITSYDFAIFLDLDIYGAHLDFAEKYEKMGLLDRALKEYIIAYEIDPRDKKIKDKISKLKEVVDERVG